MTYDPDRTTVLPPVGYPITEELPAVLPKRSGRGGRFFLLAIAAFLVVALAAAGAVLFLNKGRDTAASIAQPTPDAEPALTTVAPAATPAPLPDSEPSFWQVTGVPDGLNVRSGPGTDNDIIGTLQAGQRHVYGTGERASIGGAAWTQVALGEGELVGWVSSRFLASDTPPDPNAPAATTPPSNDSVSVVCFEGQAAPTRIARIEFAGSTITGIVRTVDGSTTSDQQIAGTLDAGSAVITLTSLTGGETSQQIWRFNPASVDLGNGVTLSVVACSAIQGLLP